MIGASPRNLAAWQMGLNPPLADRTATVSKPVLDRKRKSLFLAGLCAKFRKSIKAG